MSFAALRSEWTGARLNFNPGTFGTPAARVRTAVRAFQTETDGWPLAQYERGRVAVRSARQALGELWPHAGLVVGAGTTSQVSAFVPAFVRACGRVRLLTTTEEHEGGLAGWLAHPEVEVVQVAPAEVIEVAARGGWDVVFVSEVAWTTGERIDTAALEAVVGEALLVVDAAQAVGPVCFVPRGDVGVASLHKWLAAPAGTGFGWLSPRARARLHGTRWAGHALDPEHELAEFEPAGGLDYAAWAGVGVALELYGGVGEAPAAARVRALGQRLAEGVAVALAPWRPRFATGATFTEAPTVSDGGAVVARFPREVDPYAFYRALDAAGLHAKCIKSPVHNQLRWGVPWWEDEARVDEALGMIRNHSALLGPRP